MNISVMTFDANRVDSQPKSRTLMGVLVYDADGETVLANFDVEEIVNHFGVSDLLDEIGEKLAREHFNL